MQHPSGQIEQNGVDYHFVTRTEMTRDIDKFLETAEVRFVFTLIEIHTNTHSHTHAHAHKQVHGNIYGTSFASVNHVRDSGKIPLLERMCVFVCVCISFALCFSLFMVFAQWISKEQRQFTARNPTGKQFLCLSSHRMNRSC